MIAGLTTTAATTDEAKRAADVAVLPVGSFEQHGVHLPLITDTIVACAIAKSAATAHNLMLLPPVTISCSQEHLAERPDLLVLGMRGYTDSGVIGRPSLATPTKGKAALDSLTASFAATLAILRNGLEKGTSPAQSHAAPQRCRAER